MQFELHPGRKASPMNNLQAPSSYDGTEPVLRIRRQFTGPSPIGVSCLWLGCLFLPNKYIGRTARNVLLLVEATGLEPVSFRYMNRGCYRLA